MPAKRVVAVLVMLSLALCLSAQAQSGKMPLPKPGICVYNLSEYQKLTGKTITLKDPPLLAALVKAGKLPKIKDRLPEDPVVEVPFDEVGVYGGRITVPMMSPASWWPASQGTTEYVTTRDMRYPDTLLPSMAKSWNQSADMKSVTITFRKGLRWSDGVEFTTDDVLFWWQDYELNKDLNPSVPLQWSPQGHTMKLEVLDKYTVKVSFDVAYPTFMWFLTQQSNMGMQSQFFLPKHALSKFHIKYNKDADKLAKDAGYGSWIQYFLAKAVFHRDAIQYTDIPYMGPWIVKRTFNDGVLWERNPYYFKVDTEGNQLPYLDELRGLYFTDTDTLKLRTLSGDFDYVPWGMSASDVPMLVDSADQSNLRIIMTPGSYATECCLYINQTYQADPALGEVLRTRDFKHALSLAINRNELNKVVAFGLAIPGQAATHPKNSYYEEKWAKSYAAYDPAQANALLDGMGLKARDSEGFRLLPNGKQFTLVAEFPIQVAVLVKSSELIKEYWGKIGVRTLIKSPDWAEMYSRFPTGEFMVVTWPMDSVSAVQERTWTEGMDPFRPSWTMPLWWAWQLSGGKRGIEPPKDIKNMFALMNKRPVVTDVEFVQIAKQVLDFAAEDLSAIGTIGYMKYPTVTKKNLGNVDAITVYGFSADPDGLKSHRPEVFFWKK